MKKNQEPPFFPTATTISPETEIRIALKIPQFGSRYDVTVRQVHRWLGRGLPHLKLSPRNIRIPVPEADRWLSETFSRRRQRTR